MLALGGDLLYAPFVNVTSLSTHTAFCFCVVCNLITDMLMDWSGSLSFAILNQEISAELPPSKFSLVTYYMYIITVSVFNVSLLCSSQIDSLGQPKSL